MGVDTTKLQKGFNAARRDINAFGNNVTSLGLGIAAIGGIGAMAFGKVVMAASRLEEQTDRAKLEFGKYSSFVIDQAEKMATAFGLVKATTLSTSSVLAAMFEQAGYTGDAIAKLSVHFVKVTADMGRYADVTMSAAIEDIKSGLAGHPISLLKYGINLKQANLEQYAFTAGITETNRKLTESEKVQATVGLIAQRTAKMWENLANTGDKVAGAVEAVQGRFENLMATIGGSQQSGVSSFLLELQVNLQAIDTYWKQSEVSAAKATDGTMAGLMKLNQEFSYTQLLIVGIADGWQLVTMGFTAMQGIVESGISALLQTFRAFVKGLGGMLNQIPGFNLPTKFDFVDSYISELDISIDKLMKESEKMMTAPWAHDAIPAAQAQALQDILKARKELHDMGKLDVTKFKPIAGMDKAAKGKHHEFADAMEFGSKEAANTILRSMYGGAQANGPAEQTAANTAFTNQLLAQINASIAFRNPISITGF
jgi:hypothetical protein